VSQQKGKTAMMTCLVNANPIEQVFWLRDGVRLDNSTKWHMSEWSLGEYQQMYAATVSNLDSADYGVYECVAQNRFGQDSDKINLHGMCFEQNV
jgi:Immunoglobulin I-set domain